MIIGPVKKSAQSSITTPPVISPATSQRTLDNNSSQNDYKSSHFPVKITQNAKIMQPVRSLEHT